MKELIPLKTKDLKTLREKWYTENEGICPILGKEVEFSDTVVDHQHKLKDEDPSPCGKGLCRGVLHFQANAWEGKVTNAFKRLGLNKHVELSTALRNLADYLDENKVHSEDIGYIHPNEVKKPKKLKKTCYNKLVKKNKCSKRPLKIPPYTGNFTKKIEELLNKYNIEPEFYK